MASGTSDILLAGTREASVRAWSEQLQRMGKPVRSAVGPDAAEAAARLRPLLVLVLLEGEAALRLAASCRSRELPLLLVFEPSGLGLLARSRDLHPLGYSLPPHHEDQLNATLQAAVDTAREGRTWRLALASCREQAAMHEEALSMGGIAIWEWDVRTDTVQCSPFAAGLLGLAAPGAVHLPTVLAAVAPARRGEVMTQLAAARAGQTVRFEVPMEDRDRSPRLLEFHAKRRDQRVLGTVRDISARSGLREELSKRAEQLQTILDNIPVLVTQYDPEGRMQRLNETAEKALGWSQKEAGEIDFLAACLPDPEYRREIWEFMRSAHGWRDIRLVARSGEVLETAWTNVRLADGSQLGIGVDVSESRRRERQLRRLYVQRERALKRLREREREFELLAENSPDIIARFDREFRHVYVNPAIELVTGMSRKQFIGKTNRDLGMHEDNVKHWNSELSALFSTAEPRTFNFSFSDPRGKVHIYESRLVPETGPDGRVRTALSIARDVTAHVELEQNLRESERLFRELTEHIDEVFWLTQWPENRVIYVSPAFERIWGRKPGELYADPMLWVEAIVEEERHEAEAAFLQTVAGGGYDMIFRIRRPDGEIRWIRDRGFAIRDERGEVHRIAGVALDITELKGAEEKLRRSIEELAQAKQATDSANEQLSRANEMLANLSQEDALTGVGNRRFLEQFVGREWLRERRHHHEIALIMTDVDQFKAYNDRYGHATGDDCLRQVARALARQLHRPTDILARYGGEEFCAVLPETDLRGAARIAELMREAVMALGLPHEDSAAGVVTLSFGVSVAEPGREEFVDLLTRTDGALYRAKAGGRNRVEVAAAPYDHR